jgi:hypothetical protein
MLYNRSCLALALGVTKFTTIRDIIWSHIVVLLKSVLYIQQISLLQPYLLGSSGWVM